MIKRKLTIFFLIFFLLLPFNLQAKGFHFGIISAVKEKVEELKKAVDEKKAANRAELADNTKILTTATVDQLEKIEDNAYYFDTQATDIAGLKSGDIILSTKDEGFLRKVTNVATSGNQYVVYTTTATIEEAFKELYVHVQGSLTPADIKQNLIPLEKGISLRAESGSFYYDLTDVVLYDKDGVENSNDEILANGSITIKYDYDLKIDSEWLNLKEANFTLTIDQTAILELSSKVEQSIEEEVELRKYPLNPIPIPTPPSPVPLIIITPEITLVAGVNAIVGCKVTSKITQKANFTIGVTYLNGRLYPTGTYNNTYQYDPPSLSAAGEIKGYVGPKVEFKVMGYVGPYLMADGYLKLDIDALPNLKWTLYGGLEGFIGIDMTAFKSSLGDLRLNLLDFLDPKPEKEIASGEEAAPNNAPTISSLTANPSTIYVNQTSTITCTASDADGDTLTYTWDATRGTFTGSGSQVVYNGTNSGTQTITCTVSDGNGGTDTETVNVTVISNNAPVISSLTTSPSTVILNQGTTITCTASDADADTLTYTWSAASGTLTGSGAQVIWTAPAVAGSYTVFCLVSDTRGGTDSETVSISVTGSWQTQAIDSTGDVGAYPSLAFDSSNNPHISYYDDGNTDLKYTKWTGSTWSSTTIDSTGDIGEYTSLRLDTLGNSHIAYRDNTNESLKYAEWDGSTWNTSTVLSSGEPGMYTSLALDSSNNPQIATRGFTDYDLIFVWWNSFAWSWYAVDSTGRVGEFNSIQIDTSNNAHIAYIDVDNGTLKYAKGSGASWTIETVAGTGTVVGYIALALDSSNNPHIVFSGDGSSGYLKYATKSDSTWSVTTIDTVNATGFPSIVIDSSKNPHVSYHDWTNKDLKYARWTGSAWVVMTVDSSGNQGPESSIALDTSGNPHIAYYDGTNGDLKYASWIP